MVRFIFTFGLVIFALSVNGLGQRNPTAVEAKRDQKTKQFTHETVGEQTTATPPVQIRSISDIEKREPAKVLRQPRASRPPNSGLICAQGSVLLKVELRHDGSIGTVKLVRGLLPAFDQQAILAAERIEFIPATIGGVPTTTIRIFEYPFTIY